MPEVINDSDPAANRAEAVVSYARQAALLDEAHKLAVEKGWSVHREPLGSPLPTLICCRANPARLVFIEAVPEAEVDWRDYLDVARVLELVANHSDGAVAVVVASPSEWDAVTSALDPLAWEA